MKTVDFIIPVYNAETSIVRCIETILEQVGNWDLNIICINDGSTDDTESILKNMSQKNNHIKYLTVDNGGAANARNLGLTQSSAEYICFVDADDYLKRDYLKNLFQYMTSNVDVVISEAIDVDTQGKIIGGRKSNTVWYGNVNNAFNPEAFYSHFTVWGCLFKREILKEVKFQTQYKVGEDTLYLFTVLQGAKICHIPYCGYYYVQSSSSLTSIRYTSDCLDEVNAWLCISKIYAKYPTLHKRLISAASRRAANHILNLNISQLTSLEGEQLITLFFSNIYVFSVKQAINFLFAACKSLIAVLVSYIL